MVWMGTQGFGEESSRKEPLGRNLRVP